MTIIMDVSRCISLLNSFPGNQADPRSVLALSWNCQVHIAEERVQGRGAQGDPPRFKNEGC